MLNFKDICMPPRLDCEDLCMLPRLTARTHCAAKQNCEAAIMDDTILQKVLNMDIIHKLWHIDLNFAEVSLPQHFIFLPCSSVSSVQNQKEKFQPLSFMAPSQLMRVGCCSTPSWNFLLPLYARCFFISFPLHGSSHSQSSDYTLTYRQWGQ